MGEDDWDVDMATWTLMSRCNKVGRQIYPHNTRQAYRWAEQAYQKAVAGGPSPETLRDTRFPGLKQAIYKRKRNLMSY